ncbi:MAG: tRNA uridine-5-carboxymethylaminomethyl(34) synthesis GTPase MnmE [Desulfobacterales bacterium]|nr:tRNA uridine-5-carboxymethylaminomethyl(34) synthesis GTPase MnmE [Desulfobacterales bacterium]
MNSDEDTIAAVATPIGQAGIGIVRISGPKSAGIAKKIFRPKRPLKDLKSHHLFLGRLYDPSSGAMVDEVLLSFMKAPNSYTQEDVIEINSHSGHLLLSRILRIILDQGARPARPGEFTFRAFANGRIDLTQAEAVVDLINSKSDRGLVLASRHIQGHFRKKIEALRQDVVDILARVEAAIDFPEEENAIMTREEAGNQIRETLIKPTRTLIEANNRNRPWVDGIHTVIAGRVNAGKSSLLNRLLHEPRAIVTPIPGTTRDVIESTISIGGLPFHLMDTAGFGEIKDEVERIGIKLAGQKLAEADFSLLVIDQSRAINQVDLDIISRSEGKKALIVINKIDLPSKLNRDLSEFGLPVVRISALTGQGLDRLREALPKCILGDNVDLTSSGAAPNIRQRRALTDANQFFENAASRVEEESPMEIVAMELKSGLDALGEITGETTNEEILESIFSQFCLGK